MSSIFELPADQYQRYRIAADIVNALRGKHKALKILEVGGYPPRLHEFLPDDDVLITDLVSMSEKLVGHGTYTEADALSLQFDDQSFDAVVALDVLEHIPPEKRENFVSEISRVASVFVVIASPFDEGKGIISREELLLFEFIREAHGYEHKYFDEHLRYGLPSTENIINYFKRIGWNLFTLPNGYFPRWFSTILLEYTAEFNTTLKEILPKLREYYNYNFYKLDNREPAYRHAIVAARNPFTDVERHGLHRITFYAPGEDWPPMEYAATLIEMTRIMAQTALENRIKGLDHDLAAREEEIRHLKRYIRELEDFVTKVKRTLPYRIYSKLFKK